MDHTLTHLADINLSRLMPRTGYNVPELQGLELVLDYETIAAIYLGACQKASHTPTQSAFTWAKTLTF